MRHPSQYLCDSLADEQTRTRTAALDEGTHSDLGRARKQAKLLASIFAWTIRGWLAKEESRGPPYCTLHRVSQHCRRAGIFEIGKWWRLDLVFSIKPVWILMQRRRSQLQSTWARLTRWPKIWTRCWARQQKRLRLSLKRQWKRAVAAKEN